MKRSRTHLLVSLLTFFILLSTYSSFASLDSNSLGFRVDLTHVDAGKGYSIAELISRATQRSKIRASKLSNHLTGPVIVFPSEGEYVLNLAIGTPPLHYTGILDTGSDLIWTQCTTCMKCIHQPAPYFDPFRSSSFSPIPCAHKLCRALARDGMSSCEPTNCMYHYSYGDGTDSIGFIGTETFTFGSVKIAKFPKLGFGCGMYNAGDIQNSSGVVGFGRGPISLISQLGVNTFSYCFTDNFKETSTKSPLFFGYQARLTGHNVRTIPFIQLNPTIRPFSSFYYMAIKGISLGNTLLPIPPESFRIKRDGSGGMIIDSGTAFLMLETAAYKPFVDTFRKQVKLPVSNMTVPNFELCYNSPPNAPKLVFHFEGADWEMPESNYVLSDDEAKLYCVAVNESPGLSTLGNMQTQNTHVLYDLKNNKLSFMPENCEQM